MSALDKETIVGKLVFLFLKLLIVFLILSIGAVLFYRFVPVFYTPLMVIRHVQSGDSAATIDHTWVPLDHISEYVPLALAAGEDAHFLEHGGFDTEAILAAMKHNGESESLRGASTISQQTAKNVFLYPSRSFVRKGLEAYFTLLIETAWSKRRIMEVYLNSIEFGPGIYGIEAAAMHYYGCHASQLTRAQAASLAAVVPAPLSRNPLRPDGRTIRHRNRIRRDMSYLESHGFSLRLPPNTEK